MLEWCERDLDKDGYFQIEGIVGHRKEKDAGRGYLVHIKWGDGTSTWNDLGTTFQDCTTLIVGLIFLSVNRNYKLKN